jgi:hypothetical protein
MRLLFLCLFIAVNVHSQGVNLGYIKDFHEVLYYVPDTVRGKLTVIYPDRYEQFDLRTPKKEVFPLHMDSIFLQTIYKPMLVDSTLYFVGWNGGLVHVMKNDSIKRIDNSFEHKMQINSNQLVHNKRIYIYGGYGFWSVRNFFTYFDVKTREWELYQPQPWSKNAPELFGAYDLKIGDDLYLFNGFRQNPHNRLERLELDEVWHYSFKKNIWKFLGNGKVYVNNTNEIINSLSLNDKKYIFTSNGVIEIDLKKNKKTIYKHSIVTNKVNLISLFFWKNRFYYTSWFDKDNIRFNVVPAGEFFGEKQSETYFYKNNAWWFTAAVYYVLLPLAAMFLIWKAIVWLRKAKKINLLSNGLRYKDKFTECDDETMQILKTLLENTNTPSNEILRLVEKSQFSPAHNERIKVQKISDLNIKLKTLLGTGKDIITSVKSKDDRRIRLYNIQREYFHVKS